MNRSILFFSLFILFACEDENEVAFENSSENQNTQLICYFPPMPRFPGGYEAIQNFVNKNLKYPLGCVEGRVYVQFTVNEDGSVSDAKVIKGLCIPCDKNALEIFSKMPKWIPGQMQGKPVKTKMVYSVKFTI